MKFGIFDFNEPIDSCIEQGAFHAYACDEFIDGDVSPIGNTVIGINMKSPSIDAIATVVGSDTDWSFRTEDATVLKLDVTRLAHPISLGNGLPQEIVQKIAHQTQGVFPVSETLGINLFQIAQNSGQAFGSEAKTASLTHRLSEIQEILTRGDLTAETKVEMILAKDGLGKFGDAVWARDIKHRFDLEGVMGDQLRVVHIRPWSVCTEAQRVEPDNALLLPAEIADAFENGYVTFDEEGHIVISGYMMRKIWNLDGSTTAYCAQLEMNRGRHLYMHDHRENIFEHWLRAA